MRFYFVFYSGMQQKNVAKPITTKVALNQTIKIASFFRWLRKPTGIWVTMVPVYEENENDSVDLDFRPLTKEEISPWLKKLVEKSKKKDIKSFTSICS